MVNEETKLLTLNIIEEMISILNSDLDEEKNSLLIKMNNVISHQNQLSIMKEIGICEGKKKMGDVLKIIINQMK